MNNKHLDPKNRKMSIFAHLVIFDDMIEKEKIKESLIGLYMKSSEKALSFGFFIFKYVLFFSVALLCIPVYYHGVISSFTVSIFAIMLLFLWLFTVVLSGIFIFSFLLLFRRKRERNPKSTAHLFKIKLELFLMNALD